jgi:probable HAF family extracellular repeat protein
MLGRLTIAEMHSGNGPVGADGRDLNPLSDRYSRHQDGINSSGQVVGGSGATSQFPTRAFLYGNGKMTDLDTLPCGKFGVDSPRSDLYQRQRSNNR